MPKYFKNEQALNENFDKFLELMKYFDTVICKKYPDIAKDVPIDARDTPAFVCCIYFGKADFTKEEFEKACLETITQLKKDPKELFDKTYDIYENYNPEEDDLSTPEGLWRCFTYVKYNQGFAKTLLQNPEYYDERYRSSMEGQRKIDGIDNIATLRNEHVDDEMKNLGCSISFMQHMENQDHIAELNAMIVDDELDHQSKKMFDELRSEINPQLINGKGASIVTLNVPEFVYHAQEIHDHTQNPNKPVDGRYADANLSRFVNFFADAFFGENNTTNDINKVLFDSDKVNTIFIDGHPLNEGLTAVKGHHREYTAECSLRLARAILEGKAIDVANSYAVGKEVKTKITTVNYTFNQNQKKAYCDAYIVKHYGWWHRHVFNFGRWKIPNPIKEDNDIMNQNSKTRKERHAAIKNFMHAEVEEKYYPKLEELELEKQELLRDSIKSNEERLAAKKQGMKENDNLIINDINPPEEENDILIHKKEDENIIPEEEKKPEIVVENGIIVDVHENIFPLPKENKIPVNPKEIRLEDNKKDEEVEEFNINNDREEKNPLLPNPDNNK